MEWTCGMCGKEWIDDCSYTREVGDCDCIEYNVMSDYIDISFFSQSSYKAAMEFVKRSNLKYESLDVEVHSKFQTSSFTVGIRDGSIYAERL